MRQSWFAVLVASIATATALVAGVSCGLVAKLDEPWHLDCDGRPPAPCGCVDLGSDPDNCGTCGHACAPGGVCSSGSCACPSGSELCGGVCTDILTNDADCGGCGVVCGAGTACSGGGCCPEGMQTTFCSSANACVNTSTDLDNCGTCGTTCSASELCCAGTCADTTTSADDCGACGHACVVDNGVSGCATGDCVIASCTPPFQDCDNTYADGCETNTGNDPSNCGTCGNACGAIPNGTIECASGVCAVASCSAPFQDCDHAYADGCETNTGNDPNNCGGCGHVCAIANGTAGCASGSCVIAGCNGGFADCDGNPSNGCETDTTTDSNNCGSCGHVCGRTCTSATSSSATSCSAGSCQPSGAAQDCGKYICDTGSGQCLTTCQVGLDQCAPPYECYNPEKGGIANENTGCAMNDCVLKPGAACTHCQCLHDCLSSGVCACQIGWGECPTGWNCTNGVCTP